MYGWPDRKILKAPYEDYNQNPILQANETWKCPGHGTFVKQDDGKHMYIHHAYNKESNIFTGREGMLAELEWTNGNDWPSFVSQTISKSTANNISTTFKEKKAAHYWQWDFRNAMPVIKQQKGMLYLSGTFKESNKTGVALTVRPVSRDFDITTTVANSNEALKGLVFYGDANAAVGIGTINNTVEFWMVKDNTRTVLATQNIKAGVPVQLKLTMKPGLTCEVFYKQEETGWQQIGSAIKQQLGFLPQWDRSPRPGLHFKGSPTQQAAFSSFELINR